MPRSSGLSATTLLAMLLLLAGCADGRAPRNLGDRLQTELSPELASGGIVLQRLPDGARVTLADQTLFPTGGAELGAGGRFVLTSLVQALLAPPLLRVDVTGAAGEPLPLQEARARAVTQFLHDIQVAPNLLFISLQEAVPDGAAPQATTVTVTLPGNSSQTGHST